ncbi:allose kinase [Vibrio campbellii]|uniref:allose kinase n=1 Tax=Vibrio campbellii TaxID=680 RepID=UPI001F083000|nr:allose kinase [Vibrio campbellii]UMM04828.1 allose kinase [Vibrio campbellii]
MKRQVFIGMDIGGTHSRLCVLDKDKNVLHLEKLLTSKLARNGFIDGIISLIDDHIHKLNVQVDRIIVGLPATISKDRTSVLSTPNLKIDIQEFNSLVSSLESQLNCKAELERDVNLQLAYDVEMFELTDKSVIGCYVGTGFGFSVWMNKDIYVGANGVAGEIGHIPYGDDGKVCGCGKIGCLETLVSGTQLKHEYESQNASYPISDFFLQQDNQVYIDRLVTNLAKAVTTSIKLFDPDVVLLGGGVIDMNAFPFPKLEQQVLSMTSSPISRQTVALTKASSSSFNGALGAAQRAEGRYRQSKR